MSLPGLEPFTGSAGTLADPPWHKLQAVGVDRLVKKDGSGRGTPNDTNLDDLAYWDADSFSADQYSQFVARFTGPGNGTKYLYLIARHAGTDLSSCTNYRLESDGGSDTALYKTITGTTTALSTANATTFISGDVFRLTCNGTAISVTRNGATILSVTDSAVTAGVAGMGGSGAAGILFDDWEGGNYSLTNDAFVGQQSTDGNGFTTSAIDTTGENFLAAVVSDSDGTSTLTDSKSNTWTKRTVYGAGPKVAIWYCANATVGTGHTFTITATGKFPTLCVGSFPGVGTVSAFDVENGASHTSVSATQPGSITPSLDGELLIVGFAGTEVNPGNIDNGFTFSNNFTIVGGQAYGGSLAYLTQSTAAAINPQESWAGSSTGGIAIAAFKAAVVATQVPYNPWLQRAPLVAM